MKKKTLFHAAQAFFFLSFVLLTCIQPCYAKKDLMIPAPLAPWVDWALHGQEEEVQCVADYNDAKKLRCNWPTELNITLTDHGGTFEQSWHINHKSWILLPGNSKQWPVDVLVNGKPVVVTARDDSPAIKLESGNHVITGSFLWPRLPEFLQIPPQSGLVALAVNNKTIVFPNIDPSGHIWLKRVDRDEKLENRLKIKAYRLIEDTIPARMTVHFTLDVAGSARETTLGPIYSTDTFIPLSLQSSLPAKLEEDGRIRVQLRPGQYSLTLILRHVGPLQKLSFVQPGDGFWPQLEVWSFLSRPTLRLVETTGAPSIDPLQTSLPKQWRKYPAYRLESGDTLQFKEIKRGDPQPPPDQLSLNRTLWLRFDGSGYTIKDRITGQKNTQWRLEMSPAIKLGKVVVDGTSQAITKKRGSEKSGVELRKGILNVTADSIFQGSLANLPATGWDHDFQAVKGKLHLPPGWKLLATGGIDNIRQTWLKRWTLLDFFLVLIFTIAVARLFSIPMAVLSFVTLVLIFHEPGAPRYIWLALLAGFALLKYLPDGTFKKFVKIYQAGAALLLVLIIIPYSIHALRVGIYPQLAKPYLSMAQYSKHRQSAPAEPQAMEEVLDSAQTTGKTTVSGEQKTPRRPLLSRKISSYSGSRVMQYDPKSLTQTGPGLPQWQPFETIPFSWSGPVSRDQSISFTLIGPRVNLLLSFVRVALIITLALTMFGIWYRRGKGIKLPDFKSLFIYPCFILALCSPGLAESGDIPSQEMLNELQERLLEKDDCFPDCADIQDIHIRITPDDLNITATIDAQIQTAVPIPGHVQHWLPNRVLTDNTPAQGLLRTGGHLWLLIPKGKHTIHLSGPVRKQNSLQLVFPLKPHYATVDTEGWSVTGLHSQTTFDSQLQFKRITEGKQKRIEILETGVLPPFARVERSILLGLVWKMETIIKRVGPTGSPMVFDLPLLQGESVTTENIRVENGVAKINFRPNQTRLKWESFLEPTDRVTLTHGVTNKWTEIWKVDVSPIFHMEYEGIPVILHKTGNRWFPTWHPWPGETVTLAISRPQGADGRTMTIEKSHLQLRPGNRSTSAQLTLSINSSQGEQQTISLPPRAELQEVTINNKVQLIRQEGQQVILPITPGSQNIVMKWREPRGMSSHFQTSTIDLGNQSVNSHVDVHLPRNRWPLFTGGEQLVGPAVLFWSVFIILVIVAFGLSRTSLTPLKFYQWLLLGIGMSMSNLAACLIVVGWLMALAFREKLSPSPKNNFNRIQVGIGVLTFGAMAALLYAISHGLLGHPDMNILGNGSSSSILRWYQDVSDSSLPRAWVFSIPMWAYRLTMLAWALWVSFWLISILKWGWQRYTQPVIWYTQEKKGSKNESGEDSDEKSGLIR